MVEVWGRPRFVQLTGLLRGNLERTDDFTKVLAFAEHLERAGGELSFALCAASGSQTVSWIAV